MNRYAEIYYAYANGTLCEKDLGNTRVSLQSVMRVTTVTAVQSNRLVASEPVSWGTVCNMACCC